MNKARVGGKRCACLTRALNRRKHFVRPACSPSSGAGATRKARPWWQSGRNIRRPEFRLPGCRERQMVRRRSPRIASARSMRRRRHPARAPLSTKARFRGPLVAQTPIGRLAQPCGTGLTDESKALQMCPFRGVRRRTSWCLTRPHAGGRGFESLRSRNSPANRPLLLAV